MATLDIREFNGDAVIHQIIFNEPEDKEGDVQAYKLTCGVYQGDKFVSIYDGGDDFLNINSEQEALDLIKALNKAIELRWVD
jgi:hypothetical protein